MPRTRTARPRADRQPRVECFLLCDFARAEKGKLHIVGGGWDQIIPQQIPLDYPSYVAIKLAIPKEMAGGFNEIRVQLFDDSGNKLGNPLLEGEIQSPRSPQVELPEEWGPADAPVLLAFSTLMHIEQPGRFVLRLLLNEIAVGETGFTVTPPLQNGAAEPGTVETGGA